MIRYLKRASDCTSQLQSNLCILLYPDFDFIWLLWVNLWGHWPDWAMNVFDIRQRWVSNPEHCTVTDVHGRSKKLGILAINVIIALKSTCGVDSCIFDQWAQPIDLVCATHCELIGTECLRLNRHNQMVCYFSIARQPSRMSSVTLCLAAFRPACHYGHHFANVHGNLRVGGWFVWHTWAGALLPVDMPLGSIQSFNEKHVS